MIIIKPKHADKVYDSAAEIFSRLYKQVTGIALDIVTEDNGCSDAVIIGSDAVNDFLVYPMLEGSIPNLGIRYGTDDYVILSHTVKCRNFLILAGGRGRSTVYAVYDFFERNAGCHYFWDGDVIPRKKEISIYGLNVHQSPRFEYRGLRYFAHRGLKRFQAEHWGFEDWKREIDWMLKKRLNFFMLRIGMDDLWQRVFPDSVSYPEPNESHPDKKGFYDRSVFWPLEYRGILREKIIEYASSYDLIHPEDCGTMTHWYSPTPADYLKNHDVKLMGQADTQYFKPEMQIWDITKQENMDNYMALTKGYVREYNPKAQIFHTIGMAERNMLKDRESNLRLKLFAYRKIAESLRQNYPNSKLLIASWDFVGFWKGFEVQKLTAELDPERTLILDYTSDIDDDSLGFKNWGIMGKFPWIFGIFHAYEAESSLRGPYGRYDERLALAAADEKCKGMVFWPELSHSDPLVLEYLSANSWSPLEKSIEAIAKQYCNGRYGQLADTMNEIWQTSLPVIKLCDWGGHTAKKDGEKDDEKYIFGWDVHKEMWFDRSDFEGKKSDRTLRHYKYKLGFFEGCRNNFFDALLKLAYLDENAWADPFVLRDGIDIARTLVGRYMNYLIMKAKIHEADGERDKIISVKATFEPLMDCMCQILSANNDFSLYDTLKGLNEVCPVNKNFEHTLKGNLIINYNRQYCHEAVSHLYSKECSLAFEGMISGDTEGFEEKYQEYEDAFMNTPLEAMYSVGGVNIKKVLETAANIIKNDKSFEVVK